MPIAYCLLPLLLSRELSDGIAAEAHAGPFGEIERTEALGGFDGGFVPVGHIEVDASVSARQREFADAAQQRLAGALAAMLPTREQVLDVDAPVRLESVVAEVVDDKADRLAAILRDQAVQPRAGAVAQVLLQMRDVGSRLRFEAFVARKLDDQQR